MSCDVGHRRGSDLVLLWLWYGPTTTVPIRPPAWKPPRTAGEALKRQNTKRKEKKKKERKERKKERKKKELENLSQVEDYNLGNNLSESSEDCSPH